MKEIYEYKVHTNVFERNSAYLDLIFLGTTLCSDYADGIKDSEFLYRNYTVSMSSEDADMFETDMFEHKGGLATMSYDYLAVDDYRVYMVVNGVVLAIEII